LNYVREVEMSLESKPNGGPSFIDRKRRLTVTSIALIFISAAVYVVLTVRRQIGFNDFGWADTGPFSSNGTFLYFFICFDLCPSMFFMGISTVLTNKWLSRWHIILLIFAQIPILGWLVLYWMTSQFVW